MKFDRSGSRRRFLQTAGLLTAGGAWPVTAGDAASSAPPKSVAAVMTIYTKGSHADVLVGKILDGWSQQGGPGPNLKLAAMYVDQFPEGDLARGKAAQHGIPIYPSIERAITLDQGRVAVDGVISIGEHGDYPWNDLGQHLYPRRRFFREILNTFSNYGRVVPVFNDKHPGPAWHDALWMYDQARRLQVPWMAGSSLPVSFRKPDFSLPMGSPLEGALAIGYSGLDIYGFHTLEFLQCILERRQTPAQGVRWVQSLPGSELPSLIASGIIQRDLLPAILNVTPTSSGDLLSVDPSPFDVFLIQYLDGLLVPVLMLPGFANGIAAVVKPVGQDPIGGLAEERGEPYPHFAYLLKGIEQMIHTGQPAYPVERTLLTAGMLDRLLHSRSLNGRKLHTPELAIDYQAVDYPHAPHLLLSSSPEARVEPRGRTLQD